MNKVNFESEGTFNDFSSAGSFNLMEARSLCEKLEKECVRFFVQGRNFQAGTQPLVAAHGGTFGTAESVHIFVHQEDGEQFNAVYKDVLLPAPSKKKSILDIFRSLGRHECD